LAGTATGSEDGRSARVLDAEGPSWFSEKLRWETSDMAESKTRASGATPGSDVDPALASADDATVIARVSTARKVGDEDKQGVEELLRRAADRNRAALDRLAK
jgi:hypothetical protein